MDSCGRKVIISRLAIIGVLALGTVFVSAPLAGASGNNFELTHVFLSPTPTSGDFFGGSPATAGRSVAAIGDKVLIGAPGDDTGGNAAGAAYVFDVNTFQLVCKLSNPNPFESANFGSSVAGFANSFLVGGSNTGAAYMFEGSTCQHIRTFATPPGAELFGFAVGSVGSNVLVAAPRTSTVEFQAGAVYVFDGLTGQLIHTLHNPTPGSVDLFGEGGVAGVGARVLVGTPRDDTTAFNSGAAYLFDALTGQLVHTFLNPTPADHDNFGLSVGGLGDDIIVGAPFDDVGQVDSGAVHLFDGSTGQLLRTFFSPTSSTLGSSLASASGNVLSGAPFEGATYLFDSGTSQIIQRFPGGFFFGQSVAALGTDLFIGSPRDNTAAPEAGAVYLFRPRVPATLTISPVAATNQVNTVHCVTATVTDRFGNPTPTVTAHFKVTGVNSASGSDTTDTNGEAELCYTGQLFGPDTITAFADSNNNGQQDPGEPFNIATKIWTLPPSTALCSLKITEGGRITADNGDKATFGGNTQVSESGDPKGQQTYQDHGPAQPMMVKSTTVLSVICSDQGLFKEASIFGEATIDGSGSFNYVIQVEDHGEPGTQDTYRILLSNGYDSGKHSLEGGNVQIHKN